MRFRVEIIDAVGGLDSPPLDVCAISSDELLALIRSEWSCRVGTSLRIERVE